MGKKQVRVLQSTNAVVAPSKSDRVEAAKAALNETLVRTGAKAPSGKTKPDDKPASALVSDAVRNAISAAPKTPAETMGKVNLPAAPNAGFRPAKFALNSTITVVATANPKRPGTKAHRKWPLYTGCATVADVIQAFVKAGWPKRRALSALRWDSGHGFIEINPAK